jgi:hypothetical protein
MEARRRTQTLGLRPVLFYYLLGLAETYAFAVRRHPICFGLEFLVVFHYCSRVQFSVYISRQTRLRVFPSSTPMNVQHVTWLHHAYSPSSLNP